MFWPTNRIESVSSDVESPVVKQGPQQARPRLATDTDSNTDETSSTMVMIAQSKALFDRLETEAKVGSTILFTLNPESLVRPCVGAVSVIAIYPISFEK